VQEAFVTLGSSVSSNFKLPVAGEIQSIDVTAESPGLEPTRAASKSILTELQIRNLPSNGRRLQNFVIDTPSSDVRFWLKWDSTSSICAMVSRRFRFLNGASKSFPARRISQHFCWAWGAQIY